MYCISGGQAIRRNIGTRASRRGQALNCRQERAELQAAGRSDDLANLEKITCLLLQRNVMSSTEQLCLLKFSLLSDCLRVLAIIIAINCCIASEMVKTSLLYGVR